jgi:hypothetical protein
VSAIRLLSQPAVVQLPQLFRHSAVLRTSRTRIALPFHQLMNLTSGLTAIRQAALSPTLLSNMVRRRAHNILPGDRCTVFRLAPEIEQSVMTAEFLASQQCEGDRRRVPALFSQHRRIA